MITLKKDALQNFVVKRSGHRRDTKDLLVEILNRIEERESELLVWGDTGGFFSEEELIDLIEEIQVNMILMI